VKVYGVNGNAQAIENIKNGHMTANVMAGSYTEGYSDGVEKSLKEISPPARAGLRRRPRWRVIDYQANVANSSRTTLTLSPNNAISLVGCWRRESKTAGEPSASSLLDVRCRQVLWRVRALKAFPSF